MSPARGRHRQASLTPARRAAPQRMPGSPPPSPLPATVTRHFPHRFSPPHGERSGTPARIAWERIDSPAAAGPDPASGGKRARAGGGTRGVGGAGKAGGGGGGGGRPPPKVGGDRGLFGGARGDAPSREFLDL